MIRRIHCDIEQIFLGELITVSFMMTFSQSLDLQRKSRFLHLFPDARQICRIGTVEVIAYGWRLTVSFRQPNGESNNCDSARWIATNATVCLRRQSLPTCKLRRLRKTFDHTALPSLWHQCVQMKQTAKTRGVVFWSSDHHCDRRGKCLRNCDCNL